MTDKNTDSEVKSINLGDWGKILFKEIPDILNQSKYFHSVSYSESCAVCCDVIKERRYISVFDLVEDSATKYLLAENYGLTKFYATYDFQVYFNKLTVSLTTGAGAKMHAYNFNDSISYVAYLEVVKNNEVIEKKYFEVPKNSMRVNFGIVKHEGSPLVYVGEVKLDLPEPNGLEENDKIEVRLTTRLLLEISGAAVGSIEASKRVEVEHEEYEYYEER